MAQLRLAVSQTLQDLSYEVVRHCLTPEQIQALDQDRICDLERDRVMVHLGGCLDCLLKLPRRFHNDVGFLIACREIWRKVLRPHESEETVPMERHITKEDALAISRGKTGEKLMCDVVRHLLAGCQHCAASLRDAYSAGMPAPPAAYNDSFLKARQVTAFAEYVRARLRVIESQLQKDN